MYNIPELDSVDTRITDYNGEITEWLDATPVKEIIMRLKQERDSYKKKLAYSPLPPDYSKTVDPLAVARYTVHLGDDRLLAIPNPEQNYALFSGVIRDIASGKYAPRTTTETAEH